MKLSEEELKKYFDSLPFGAANAITYPQLVMLWGKSRRAIRQIMHELSLFDEGDELILIRSSKKRGFYKTDDREEMKRYRNECLKKGKSCFAPVKKINRILKDDLNANQITIFNNLKTYRLAQGLKQRDVINIIKDKLPEVDESMLSKFENGVCLPTPNQLNVFASVYKCSANDLLSFHDEYFKIFNESKENFKK